MSLACTIAAPAMASPAEEEADNRSSRIILGAVGDVFALANKISTPLAAHRYAQFAGKVPRGSMITVGASQTWAQVAAMRQGSALHRDVVRWAREIKSRPGRPLLAYSHEPESAVHSHKGSAGEFIRAFRRVVEVFRQENADNVRFTWQMTAWSFRADPGNRLSAPRWYPGDRYVDVVGADAYNWFTCGEGSGRWMSLRDLVRPAIAFAKLHEKKSAVPEFASFTNPRRARWLDNAHDFLGNHKANIVAAFYFQQDPTNPANPDCKWKLTRDAEFLAFRRMARDSEDFRR